MLYTGLRSFLDQYETAVLRALKKIFRKGEAEQPASITPTPSAPSQPSAPRHSQPKAETPRETKKPRTD